MKYLYYVDGIASTPDKNRKISLGDSDTHAIIASSEEEALSLCPMTNSAVKSTHALGKDWQ